MSRDKTRNILLGLSEARKNEIGNQITILMASDMKYIVNKYVRQYRKNVYDILGWEVEDLIQHIKIILWHGLATYDISKNYKVTTYLSTILYNRMCNLTKKLKSKRSIKLCNYDAREKIDYYTAEDWYSYAECFSEIVDKLNETETRVLNLYLIDGAGFPEIEKKTKLPRCEIVHIIKNLKSKMLEISR